MKVIGFTGLPGSGKSTAIDAIRNMGRIVTMGDVIRNEAKKRGVEPTGENLGKIAQELRQKGGDGIVAEKCVELIKQLKNDIIFIDGIRSQFEIDVFRKYWKFPIIATVIDENTRFERLFERGRSDDPKEIEEFRERDKREIGFGLKDVVDNADYKMNNTSTIKILQKKTKKLVKKILKTL